MVIIRRVVRITKTCRDGRRRNVVNCFVRYKNVIPKEITDFEEFKDWFLLNFGTEGRWSIVKVKPNWKGRVALFDIVHRGGQYHFIGDLGKLKMSLNGRRRKMQRMAEERLEDDMFDRELFDAMKRR